LEGFCSIFYENSEIMVNRVKKFCGTGKGFDIYPFITKMALDIICGEYCKWISTYKMLIVYSGFVCE
jgi:hypothetical protein